MEDTDAQLPNAPGGDGDAYARIRLPPGVDNLLLNLSGRGITEKPAPYEIHQYLRVDK